MPTNQRHKSTNKKGLAQTTGSGTASAGEMMENMKEQMSDYVSRGASQVRHIADDREGKAVIVALGAGFGIGLLIGAALAASHSRPKSWRDRIAAEGLGHRMLDRMEQMLPESITNYVRG
jgi:hypothetical protein